MAGGSRRLECTALSLVWKLFVFDPLKARRGWRGIATPSARVTRRIDIEIYTQAGVGADSAALVCAQALFCGPILEPIATFCCGGGAAGAPPATRGDIRLSPHLGES